MWPLTFKSWATAQWQRFCWKEKWKIHKLISIYTKWTRILSPLCFLLLYLYYIYLNFQERKQISYRDSSYFQSILSERNCIALLLFLFLLTLDDMIPKILHLPVLYYYKCKVFVLIGENCNIIYNFLGFFKHNFV